MFLKIRQRCGKLGGSVISILLKYYWIISWAVVPILDNNVLKCEVAAPPFSAYRWANTSLIQSSPFTQTFYQSMLASNQTRNLNFTSNENEVIYSNLIHSDLICSNLHVIVIVATYQSICSPQQHVPGLCNYLNKEPNIKNEQTCSRPVGQSPAGIKGWNLQAVTMGLWQNDEIGL